jgi:hypothetical protein
MIRTLEVVLGPGSKSTEELNSKASNTRRGWIAGVVVFAVVAVGLFSIFRFADWRAENESLTRYCDQPAEHVRIVGRILSESDPVPKGDAKRPFIVAAKLIFLVPQREQETIENYLDRLQFELLRVCQ